MEGGRLKSQQIDGQEYPPFLFERTPSGRHAIKPEFKGLHRRGFAARRRSWTGCPTEQKDLFFAVGLEHGNSTVGSTALDVLFLREHNRIAACWPRSTNSAASTPSGTARCRADLDERLFQTTRMIMIVLVLKLVVEEYIRHIAPHDPPLTVVPGLAAKKPGTSPAGSPSSSTCSTGGTCWCPTDRHRRGARSTPRTSCGTTTSSSSSAGLEWLMAQCSRSRAGRIGLFNTPDFLTDRGGRTIPRSRSGRSRSCGRPGCSPTTTTGCGSGCRRRRTSPTSPPTSPSRGGSPSSTRDIDDLEWYVGIFAEDHPEDQIMGELLTAMVGYDAFTQALTNPVLGAQVFNEATFTRAGLKIIRKTRSLQQILARNSQSSDGVFASFQC